MIWAVLWSGLSLAILLLSLRVAYRRPPPAMERQVRPAP
jgi:hypothetical protein